MKKLLYALLAICFISTTSFAQTAPTKQAPVHPPTKQAPIHSSVRPTPVHGAAAKAAPAPHAVTAHAAIPAAAPAKMKKDGTPDRRYKAAATKTAGPMKKDGIPDMRYKANKTGAAKTGAK